MAAILQNSTLFEPISNPALPPAQAQVIAFLAQGRSVTAAALEAGTHRTTIYNWLRHEPAFKTAAENARREYGRTLNDQLRDLSARALETLRNLLDDPNIPAAIRLKAALAVLDRPRFPHPGWNLPQRIESLQEQQVIDGLAQIEEECRVMQLADARDDRSRWAEQAAP